jgi:DNA-binding beta-propeller fold protein YncE
MKLCATPWVLLKIKPSTSPGKGENMKFRTLLYCALALLPLASLHAKEKHLLYVASPGLRNYLEYGGMGILVFDIDNGYKFVKRIPTWDTPADPKKAENVKGIAASARTGRVYVSTINRMAAFDAVSGNKLWDKTYEGGCDRMAITPDGKVLYTPSLEGPHWNVVDAMSGDVITKIEPKSGSHNTVCSLDGTRVFLAGLHSPLLSVADTSTNKIVSTVGPFANSIRPFTVNGAGTLVFVNVNELLGFEVGDVRTGKKLYRVEVEGFKKGPVKRHGCPSHGIALTHDEKEIWLTDGFNNCLHIYDATVMPPKQGQTIKLRDFPGWISFSIDGRHAYSSTGDIIDTHTKKIVATLADESGHAVQSEKMLEIVVDNGKVIRAGNQFGVGEKH